MCVFFNEKNINLKMLMHSNPFTEIHFLYDPSLKNRGNETSVIQYLRGEMPIIHRIIENRLKNPDFLFR
jgi:hypothetical protein